MKRFTDIFIRRPVMASAISILILLAGLFSMSHLSIRLFPKITDPVISISTAYPGANSQVMKAYVTSVIETSLSGIEGVNYITASSSQGLSDINIYMHLGYSPQKALSAVMAKVASVSDQLPSAAEKPNISVGSADANPAMIIAFTSKNLKRREVADYLRRVIEPKLESIAGVSQAKVLGRVYAMRLWLNPLKMAARDITAKDVSQAITSGNVQAASGTTEGKTASFDVQTTTNLHNAKRFDNIFIKNAKGAYVRLKDIGSAKLGDRDTSISAYYNGQPATMVFVKLLPGANPIAVTDQIKAELPGINMHLPFDIKAHEVVDSGRYIHSAIEEVVKALIEAAVIVLLVIFLFLGSLRAMLIPVITIPLSLVGVCTLLHAFGYSINTLTLLAMVLAIGLVVDDAIIVVENIFRHIEKGMSALEAALVGAREIAYPIIAMTLTLAAVYVPIALVGGITAQLFLEFAVTLAASVIISGVVALTLSPMLASRWLSKKSLNGKLSKKVEVLYQSCLTSYSKGLSWALGKQKWVLGFWMLVICITIVLFSAVPKKLAPNEDQGMFIAMSNAPDYTSKHFLNYYAKDLNKVYKHFKSTDSQIIVTGIPSAHHAISFISLKPWGERKESSMELLPKLQSMVDKIPGIQTVVINPASLPGSSGLPLQVVLKSTQGFKKLNTIASAVMGKAWQSGKFRFIQSDLKYDQPTIHLEINRNAAGVLGISMQQLSQTLGLMLGGNKIQQFVRNGRSYFVIPQVESAFRVNPSELYKIHLKTSSGKMLPLSSVAKIKITTEPESLNQFQKMNSVTLSGELASGVSLSQGVSFLKKTINHLYPDQVSIDYAGQTRQFIKNSDNMLLIFTAAIIFIFLVLAVQFESYRSPLIILLGSVPFAVFGACLALWLGFGSINIYTEIGLITLIGLVSKHGILVTEFANQLQLEGYDKLSAIKESVKSRLRPVLMTTVAMVLGVFPLVFATGAGSVSRSQLGIVIGAGLFFGTVLTLFVLPSLYLLIAPKLQEASK